MQSGTNILKGKCSVVPKEKMQTAMVMAVCILFGFVSVNASADLPASVQFEVTVQYDPEYVIRPLPGGDSAFCIRRDADGLGTSAVISCSTGALIELLSDGNGSPWSPTHGGSRLHMVSSLPGLGQFRGAGNNIVPELGSALSWRQVSLLDRDYYELLLAW